MSPSSSAQTPGPFRVMVVDDSAIIRGFLSRYLSEDPDIEVVTTANNGIVALRHLSNYDVEAVVLDIEMPEMDGMTALPKMIDIQPDLMVVMASTLTRKNAEISLKAVQMGAVDYVPKPETARSVNANIDFRRELVEKVKAWAGRRRRKRGEALPASVSHQSLGNTEKAISGKAASGFVTVDRTKRKPQGFTSVPRRGGKDGATASPGSSSPGPSSKSEPITLVKASTARPRILAIGSSTGGPQALMKFFEQFDKAPSVPIVITQHMPATFTAILAQHLGQSTSWPSAEAVDGASLKPGEIVLAPGGKHMVVEKKGSDMCVRLTDDPPENFCKPAVDPLLRSVAKAYGSAGLCVILTGMGHDGLKGGRDLVKAGGTVVAQDEATSVVWGMPGAVATAGLCAEVSPLEGLGKSVYRRLEGKL